MRYRTLVLMALLLCLLFSCACTNNTVAVFPAVVHTPVPLSEWDDVGGLAALAAGSADAPMRSLTGVVLYRDKENIVLNAGGNTISIPAAYVSDVMLGPGDIASLSYRGMIAYQPEFSSISKVGSSVNSDTVFGRISGVEDDVLHVRIESGELYAFELDDSTVYHGADADSFRAGDAVMVIFDGKLSEEPQARDVTMLILEGAPTPVNRSLEGVVYALDDREITITADDNASYTFLRNYATEVIEPPTLQAGARVRVTFDGYAAQTPLAKEIEVIKAYATPRPVSGPGSYPYYPPAVLRTPNPMAGMPFSYIYYQGYYPNPAVTPCCSPTPTASTAPGQTTAPAATPTPSPTPDTSGDPGVDPSATPSSGVIVPTATPDLRISKILEYANYERRRCLQDSYEPLLLESNYSIYASERAYELSLPGYYGPRGENELVAMTSHGDPIETVTQFWERNSEYRRRLCVANWDKAGIGIYSDGEYDYYILILGD